MSYTDKFPELLADVKLYNDITWDDGLTNQKMTGIIKRGMASLENRIGECDFFGETEERALLFEYTMYARAGEITSFWQNYKDDIRMLQLQRTVKSYEAKE